MNIAIHSIFTDMIDVAAIVATAAIVLATGLYLRHLVRRGDVEALIEAVRPCPDCAPGPHPPAECLCVLACGSANCTGELRARDLQMWEREYQLHKARQARP